MSSFSESHTSHGRARHQTRDRSESGRSRELLTPGTSDSCRPRGIVTRDFSAIFGRLFDRLPVRISTSDLHHWILQKKIFHIRAYDFGVQFSFKGALSRYSVIFCAILLWGKIMAAVRFSMVAVLHTIRLCVDDRLDAGSSVRGGPMSVQLLRQARWHRSGFASCCWSKRVDPPFCPSLSISLAVDTGSSQFDDNTFRVLCRQALL